MGPKNTPPDDANPKGPKELDDAVGRDLEAAATQAVDSLSDVRLDADSQLIGVGSPFTPVAGMVNRPPSPCCHSPEAELWPIESPPKVKTTQNSTTTGASSPPSPTKARRSLEEDTSSGGSPKKSSSFIAQRVDAHTALSDNHLSDNLRASLLMTATKTSPLDQNSLATNYVDQQDQPMELALESTESSTKRRSSSPPSVPIFPSTGSAFQMKTAGETVYQRIMIQGEELSEVPEEDLKKASGQLVEALRLRDEYMSRLGGAFSITTRHFLAGKYPSELPEKFIRTEEMCKSQLDYHPPPATADHWGLEQPLPVYGQLYTLRRRHGLIEVLDEESGELVEEMRSSYVTKETFLRDMSKIGQMMVDGPLKSFCFRRLSLLQNKFSLHVLMNELRELNEQKITGHKDFYNVRKVDTHIHAASSMNQKHLVRFIKRELKKDGDTVVTERNGKPMKLNELFAEMGVRAEDLSVDILDVHADRNTFHRFDRFNAKYNPIGDSSLRETFLKTANYVEGKYLAELLKEVFTDLEDSKYQHTEMRLSVYGCRMDEWDKLAKWAIEKDVWSTHNRWMVQIPRLYDIYRVKGMVSSFDEILTNIFMPLFEATNDPKSHPELHRFLAHVSGFDSVDDESKHESIAFDRSTPPPDEYRDKENPPYNYYLFYVYANICALNAFRRLRGLNTFSLRPHCGEAGHVNHLLAGYLTSESISHGILLRKVPVLQYLFYLTQMGIAMSPLSNNSLFISYQRNPLPEYLQKGLNVSLSTDDPLQFHYTREALMEEYSIAAQVWKLSSTDMCELARNSVLQCGFEERLKRYWLGGFYKEEGVLGNDRGRTNLPDIRVSFRHETLVAELKNLFRGLER